MLNDLQVYDPALNGWTDLSDAAEGNPPAARYQHGFTSAGGLLYVFGGLDKSYARLSDLHSFDPAALVWRDLSSSAQGNPPAARFGHGFASAGGKLYVHGGFSGNTLSDLHSFDPVAMVWVDLSEVVLGTAPTARYQHGYTSAGGKLYVHAGNGAGLLSDLHSFDPVAMVWTDLSDAAQGTAPTPRCAHGFTSAGAELYVHGGFGGDVLSDLHSFDPAARAWTDLSGAVNGTPPAARFGHGFTSTGGNLYVHGGSSNSNNPLSDLHSLDPVAMAWAALSEEVEGVPPTARYRHGFASVAAKLYVYGGQDDTDALSELRSFDPAAMAWTDLSDTVKGIPPTARGGLGFTSAGGKLYVFGGYTDNGLVNDLHVYDPAATAWANLSAVAEGAAPAVRYEHGFASAGGELYVHGGEDGDGNPLSDFHSFDPAARVWTDLSGAVQGTPPTASYSHGFASAGGRLYVHGGVGENNNLLSDLHVFDPAAIVWKDLSGVAEGAPPAARWGHGFTSAGGRLYVHGGVDAGGNLLSDLHSFDPAAMVWTDLSAALAGTLPTPRCSHGFAAAGARLYVHDGYGSAGSPGKRGLSQALARAMHAWSPADSPPSCASDRLFSSRADSGPADLRFPSECIMGPGRCRMEVVRVRLRLGHRVAG